MSITYLRIERLCLIPVYKHPEVIYSLLTIQILVTFSSSWLRSFHFILLSQFVTSPEHKITFWHTSTWIIHKCFINLIRCDLFDVVSQNWHKSEYVLAQHNQVIQHDPNNILWYWDQRVGECWKIYTVYNTGNVTLLVGSDRQWAPWSLAACKKFYNIWIESWAAGDFVFLLFVCFQTMSEMFSAALAAL